MHMQVMFRLVGGVHPPIIGVARIFDWGAQTTNHTQ